MGKGTSRRGSHVPVEKKMPTTEWQAKQENALLPWQPCIHHSCVHSNFLYVHILVSMLYLHINIYMYAYIGVYMYTYIYICRSTCKMYVQCCCLYTKECHMFIALSSVPDLHHPSVCWVQRGIEPIHELCSSVAAHTCQQNSHRVNPGV